MLRLRLLGGLSLEDDGQTLDTEKHRRALVVLAVVATAGAVGISRDKLLAYFWPESDAEHARNAFRQRVFALRRELAIGELFTGTAELRLNPQVISSDVAELDAALASGNVERVAELYSGPLLDGVNVAGAAELEHWVETQRDRLAGRARKVFEAAGAAAARRGDHRDAARWWQAVLTIDPTSSDTIYSLISSLDAAGELALALRHFQVYEARIREYGIEPDRRVVALVRQLNGARQSWASAETSAATGRASPTVRPSEDRNQRRRSPSRSSAVTGAVVVAVVAGIAAVRMIGSEPYDDRRVVVAAFENRTGDASLNALGFMAADWIAQGLQGAKVATVVDPATAMLASNHVRTARARTTTSEVRHMANETRAAIVVTGTYYRSGDSLVMVARVSDARRLGLIGATAPESFSPLDPVPVLDRVRQRVLGVLALRLDEQLDAIVPVASITPPTYEAYREYVEGLALFQKRNYEAAIPHLSRAYALDTAFAQVLVWHAWALTNLPVPRVSERDSIVRLLSKAANRLTPLDRSALEYLRASRERDRWAMLRAAAEASRLAPGSHWSYNAASALSELGRFDEAVRVFGEIDRGKGWTRGWIPFWERFASALHFAGDYQRELEVAREARQTFPGDAWPVYWEARALAAMRRVPELNRLISQLRVTPPKHPQFGFGYLLSELGWELEMKGDSANAFRLYDNAIAWHHGLPAEEGAKRRLELGDALYRAERFAEAEAVYERVSLERPGRPGIRRRPELGCIAARRGQRERAEAILAEVLADTVRGIGEQVFGSSARIAACLGDRDRAVEFLRRHNARHRNRPYLLYVKGLGLFPQHTERDHKDFDALLGYKPYRDVRLVKR